MQFRVDETWEQCSGTDGFEVILVLTVSFYEAELRGK